MSITATCLTLAFFFSLYAVLFIVARATSKPDEKKKLLSFHNASVAFIILYVALAHFSILTSIAYAVEKDTAAPCENVISTTTLNTTSNTTTYTYADSCAGDARPATLEVLYKLVGYLIYGGFIALLIGGLYLTFSHVGGRYW